VFRPAIFGKLCLLELISIGGMAEVFRAKPFDAPDIERYLAVKRILPNLAEDNDFIEMFIDEAKIALQLNHPNICQMYELGKFGGSHYLVMEFIAGQDLLAVRNRLKREGVIMPVEMAAFIARQVASALDHAHRQRDANGRPLHIVHRDVSPQNVLISYAGDIKLIDFGIAKVADRTSKTHTGVLKGKFSYMSPEQVAGRPVDARADIFALGTVLWEMLTAKRLFGGESDFQTLDLVREARVEPPSHENPTVPGLLDSIILRSLARSPDNRFDTAHDLEDALDEFLAERPAFGQKELSAWMVQHFAEELAVERERREMYRSLVSEDDVRAYNDRLIEEIRRAAGAPAGVLDEPDEAATKVATPSFNRVVGATPTPTRQPSFEVIAENIYAPLPELIARHRANVLATVDLPEPVEPEDLPHLFEPQPVPPSGAGVGLRLPAVAIVILLVGLAAVAYLRLAGEGETEATTGALLLDAVPSDRLEIFVDSWRVGNSTPFQLPSLSPGTHQLLVRRAGYQPIRREVAIEGGRATQLNLDLAPETSPQATLRLRVDPPDAEIWIDGVRLEALGAERVATLPSSPLDRPYHLVEARHPDYRVETQRVEPELRGEQTIEIRLQPREGTLLVRAQPEGIARVDGVERGLTDGGLRVAELDPRVPHHLRIEPSVPGYRPYQTTVVFETASTIELLSVLERIGEPVAQPDPGAGFLAIVGQNEWSRVLIDGDDSGLTTPIAPEEPLALRPGRRSISLVRGDRRHVLETLIEPDQLTLIDCRAPQWACQ
jgi:hypothetical protein